MKKALFGLLAIAFLCAAAEAVVVGIDKFDYSDGQIDNANGGTGWAWHYATQTQTNSLGMAPWGWSYFGNINSGTRDVSSQALYTTNGRAMRAYGKEEWEASFTGAGLFYYSVDVTALDTQDEFGIRGYNFVWERVFFGKVSGQAYFGITANHDGNPYTPAYTSISVVEDQAYHLVCAVDYNGDQLRLWVNPDNNDYDNGAGDNTADAILTGYDSGNWNSGLGLSSTGSCKWDNLIVATTFEQVQYKAENPDPADDDIIVTSDVTLSWDPARDPSDPESPNPSVTTHKLYTTDFSDPTDPNLYWVVDIANTGSRAEHGPISVADGEHSWRVDEVLSDMSVITGLVWTFEKLSIPVITDQPDDLFIYEGATAIFSITVESATPPIYQWYKYVDGVNDTELEDGGDISGTDTDTLSIANTEAADEGEYYCVVNNASATPVSSDMATLLLKRRIAYWDFEDSSYQSKAAGSPTTNIYGTPQITAGASFNGSAAMVFDAVGQMLLTDPNDTAYFDICNSGMTVAVWIKLTNQDAWRPYVSHDGEWGGWQLRNCGFDAQGEDEHERPCFTTWGPWDGGKISQHPANRPVYDGQWHYIVGTFDGSFKKVYIDGAVASLTYREDRPEILSDGYETVGTIDAVPVPVGIAGRAIWEDYDHLVVQTGETCTGIYDDVEIYNYALDAATIAQTYADATGTGVCPTPQAYDFDGDCIVNLNDFALFASKWLEDTSVQPTP
ncbi:MAG: immunoglobulin domain-containing protein [Sedimentisphaerales bacterium]|nr:immunoglobulin domain-containing protein [Sedimentisphaerales bacterium]